MKHTNLKWIYLFALSLIWGSSFILMKKVLIGLTPVQLGSLRILFSACFLFVVGFNNIKRIKINDWKWIALTGFLGTFFPVFFFAFAQTEIDSAIASVLNSMVPLNTVVVGFVLFKIASTKKQVLGVVVGLIGTLLLIIKGASINPDQNYAYAILVILATLSYATSINVLKRYLQHVPALTIAVGNFMVIIIPAIIVLLSSGFFKAEIIESPNLKPALFYLIILSFFGTAVAKIVFNKLVQMATPVFASSVAYLMPMVAIFWGVLDGERLGLQQILASFIILIGVYLSHKKGA